MIAGRVAHLRHLYHKNRRCHIFNALHWFHGFFFCSWFHSMLCLLCSLFRLFCWLTCLLYCWLGLEPSPSQSSWSDELLWLRHRRTTAQLTLINLGWLWVDLTAVFASVYNVPINSHSTLLRHELRSRLAVGMRLHKSQQAGHFLIMTWWPRRAANSHTNKRSSVNEDDDEWWEWLQDETSCHRERVLSGARCGKHGDSWDSISPTVSFCTDFGTLMS